MGKVAVEGYELPEMVADDDFEAGSVNRKVKKMWVPLLLLALRVLSNRLRDEDVLKTLRGSILPFSTGERGRRDDAQVFRDAIEELYSVTLSISEAVLLLQLDGWDVGVALAAFSSHAVAG